MPANISLFRQESLGHRKEFRLSGEVILVRPVSFSVYTILVFAFALVLVLVLFLGTDSSKAVTQGIVVPEAGIIKVYPGKPGIINSFVDEGKRVKKSDVLFVISTERYMDNKEGYHGVLIKEISESIARLENKNVEETRLLEIKKNEIIQRIASTEKSIGVINEELKMHYIKAKLTKIELDRYIKARKDQLINEGLLADKKQAHIDSKIRLQQLLRQKENEGIQLSELQGEIKRLPSEVVKSLIDNQQTLSQLKQQLAEIEGDAHFSVVSPGAGRVASITFSAGDQVSSIKPLLSILTDDSKLEAKLYVPTRSAGFLDIDQDVLVHYEAFPWPSLQNFWQCL